MTLSMSSADDIARLAQTHGAHARRMVAGGAAVDALAAPAAPNSAWTGALTLRFVRLFVLADQPLFRLPPVMLRSARAKREAKLEGVKQKARRRFAARFAARRQPRGAPAPPALA